MSKVSLQRAAEAAGYALATDVEAVDVRRSSPASRPQFDAPSPKTVLKPALEARQQSTGPSLWQRAAQMSYFATVAKPARG